MKTEQVSHAGKQLLRLGSVGKPHGLAGRFFIYGRTEPLPSDLDTVLVGVTPQSAQKATITEHFFQQDKPTLKLSIFTSRNEVEAAQRQTLWCFAEDLEVDGENEFLWQSLVGRKVLWANGSEAGHVLRVESYGGQDLLAVGDETRELNVPIVDAHMNTDFAASDLIQLHTDADYWSELWAQR